MKESNPQGKPLIMLHKFSHKHLISDYFTQTSAPACCTHMTEPYLKRNKTFPNIETLKRMSLTLQLWQPANPFVSSRIIILCHSVCIYVELCLNSCSAFLDGCFINTGDFQKDVKTNAWRMKLNSVFFLVLAFFLSLKHLSCLESTFVRSNRRVTEWLPSLQ